MQVGACLNLVPSMMKNNLMTPLSLFLSLSDTFSLLAQMPNLREKSILLVKMMTYIEKRFPDDLELNAQFLDLVNYVYR